MPISPKSISLATSHTQDTHYNIQSDTTSLDYVNNLNIQNKIYSTQNKLYNADKVQTFPGNSLNKVEYFEVTSSDFEIYVSRLKVIFSLNITIVGKIPNANTVIYYNINMGSLSPKNISISTINIFGVNYTRKDNTNGSIIKLIFPPSSINFGQKAIIELFGEFRTISIGNTYYLNTYLKLESQSQVLSSRLQFPLEYTIVGLQPIAHQVIQTSNNLVYMWNYLHKTDIYLNVSYIINPASKLKFNANKITDTIYQGQEQNIISLNITNDGKYPVSIKIIKPDWFDMYINSKKINVTSIIINSENSMVILFRAKSDLEHGKYMGIISVYDGEQEVYSTPVNFTVESNPIYKIMAILSLIILLVMTLYFIYDKYKKQDIKTKIDINKVKNKLTRSDHISNKIISEPDNIEMDDQTELTNNIDREAVKIGNISKSAVAVIKPEIKNDIKNKYTMPERDRAILDFIINNEGVTQQIVADKFEISKATASRIISKLENNGLVEKRKVGMSNKLYYKDKI